MKKKKFLLILSSAIALLSSVGCNDESQFMPKVSVTDTHPKVAFTAPIGFDQTVGISDIKTLNGKNSTKSFDVIGADNEGGFEVGPNDGQFPKINWKVGEKQSVAYAIRRKSNPSEMLYGFLNGVVVKEGENYRVKLSGGIRVKESDINANDFQIAMFIGGSVLKSTYVPNNESRSITIKNTTRTISGNPEDGESHEGVEGDKDQFDASKVDPIYPIELKVERPTKLIGGIDKIDMPLYADWSDISNNEGKGFTINKSNAVSTTFKPWGSIIGVQLENSSDTPCIIDGISIATKSENTQELFSPEGTFRFGQTEPSFTTTQTPVTDGRSDFAGEIYYTFPLKNRAIKGKNPTETSGDKVSVIDEYKDNDLYLDPKINSKKTPIFYFWAKPMAKVASTIRIGYWGIAVSPFDKNDNREFNIQKKLQRWSPKNNQVIENGKVYVYKINFAPSNNKNSDLMISEVYHCVANRLGIVTRANVTDRQGSFNDDDIRNFSIVEIYNPTNEPINLKNYRLIAARAKFPQGTGRFHRRFVPGPTTASPDYDEDYNKISEAVGMNLVVIPQFDPNDPSGNNDLVEGRKQIMQWSRPLKYLLHDDGTDHSSCQHFEYPVYAKYVIYPKGVNPDSNKSKHDFYKKLYDTGDLFLPPHKTALYLAAGYWESYDKADGTHVSETSPDDEYVGVGKMFNITKDNGDIAFAVIVNNRQNHQSGPESSINQGLTYRGNRGTLDVQADQGFLLLRRTNREGTWNNRGEGKYSQKIECGEGNTWYHFFPVDQTGPWQPGSYPTVYCDTQSGNFSNGAEAPEDQTFSYQFYNKILVERFYNNLGTKRFFYARKPNISSPYMGRRWNADDWIYSSNKNMIGASIGARYRYWGSSSLDLSDMDEGE